MYNYSDLKSKVILITGAAGLLGNEFCKSLLFNNAIVIAIDINKDNLQKLFKEIKKSGKENNFFFYCSNLKNEKIMKELVKKIIKKFKKIDVLINNAHSFSNNRKNFFEKFENYKLDTWRQIMEINVNSTFLITQIVSRHMMKKKGGSIIQMGSIQGILGNDGRIYKGSKLNGMKINSPAVYSTSKSAIIGFTRYLATYLAKYNIRVNSISPGGIINNHNKTFVKKYSSKVPLNRMGKKNEVASAVLFLSSRESSYITGQNIVVDGGYSIW